MLSRRKFLQSSLAVPLFLNNMHYSDEKIVTVLGEIPPSQLGSTLIHEHVLVDFIGADKISSSRWDHRQVIHKVLPYLSEIKSRGIKTIVECTPAFIGRDVLLLEKISRQSGMHIVTNTGYYGASNNKYLPTWAYTETANELASRWISESVHGIEGSKIKPGFIKIGVNPETLSPLHQKLVKAAALTHLQTGLTICSHTGPSIPAFEQIEILDQHGVHPSAFVWVHANSDDNNDFIKAAKRGAWISLDGISQDSLMKYADILSFLKKENLLHRALISHDAGWYTPGAAHGGEFRGFTTISDQLIPILKTRGFSTAELDQLLIKNPAQMLTISVRKK
jgi:phosphotriesterase-related protein